MKTSFVLALALIASPAAAAETVVALWATSAAAGDIAEGLPQRFLLLDDGTVFVGGTSEVATGRVEKKDTKAIEKLVERVKKLPGITGAHTLGPGPQTYRVSLRKAGDIIARGDPAQASANLRPLAQLIEMLLAFDHPTLRPYEPATFVVSAREAGLPGGCRSWLLPATLNDVLKQPREVPAASVAGWPTGATPAVVCAGDKRYAVTLRPVLPGDTP